MLLFQPSIITAGQWRQPGVCKIADLTGDAGYSGSGQVKPCSLSLGAAGNWDPLNESNQHVIFFYTGKTTVKHKGT